MHTNANSSGLIVQTHSNPTSNNSTTNQQTAQGSNARWFHSKDGFFCLPRAIREDSSLGNAEFRVLVCLASFVFLKDQATPCLKTLKKYTGLSEGTISKATTSLEKKGWIIKEQRPYTSVLYHLTLPMQFKKETVKQPQQLPLLNER